MLLSIAVCPKLMTLAVNIMQLKIFGKQTRETNRKGRENNRYQDITEMLNSASGKKKTLTC